VLCLGQSAAIKKIWGVWTYMACGVSTQLFRSYDKCCLHLFIADSKDSGLSRSVGCSKLSFPSVQADVTQRKVR